MKERLRWILLIVLVPLAFSTSCAAFGGLLNPGARHPDSPGGERVTQQEHQQAGENVKNYGEGIAGLLAALGLPGVAAGVGVASSVTGNVYQWWTGRKYRKAAHGAMKVIDLVKDRLADGDFRKDDAVEVVKEALEQAGAKENEVNEIYHYLKQKGLL